MDIAQQPRAEQQTGGVGDRGAGVVESCDLVANLPNVSWPVGCARRLKGRNITECRLGALDLRRQHDLFANEAVEEPTWVGDHRAGDAEATDGSDRRGVSIGKFALDRQRRFCWRQCPRYERPHGLAVVGAYSVHAGLAKHQ